MPIPVPRSAKRVLFLSAYHLGWKTRAHQLEEYSKRQNILEATHKRVVLPLFFQLISREWPKPFHRLKIGHSTVWRWYMLLKYRRLILDGNFDVVFVGSQILAPALIGLCKESKTKLAVTMDVSGPAHLRDLMRQPIDPNQRWLEERSIYEAADLLAPWSEWIADSLAQDFGVPRDKILVLPPAIDTAQIPAPDVAKEEGKLPRILFCGNDWERKGGPRLLKWHQEHWTELAELHIASGKAAVPPGLKNVVCYGGVPHSRLLKEILPAADVFCMPTWQDMSPFALSEAQAAGLPTVSSRVGGIPELVIDGKTGFVLDPHDEAGFVAATTRLLKDAGLRSEMGKAARQYAVENLDTGVVFERLYRRLAEVAAGGA